MVPNKPVPPTGQKQSILCNYRIFTTKSKPWNWSGRPRTRPSSCFSSHFFLFCPLFTSPSLPPMSFPRFLPICLPIMFPSWLFSSLLASSFSSFLHSYCPPWYLALLFPVFLPPHHLFLPAFLPLFLPICLPIFLPPSSSLLPPSLPSLPFIFPHPCIPLCLLLYFPPYISLPSCSSPPLNVPLWDGLWLLLGLII